VELLLSLRSSVLLSNLDLASAASNDWASASTAAESEKAHLAQFLQSFVVATFRADNDLSRSESHTMVPLGVMTADESTASSVEPWTEVLRAESILTFASSSGIVLASSNLAFLVLVSLEGSMLLRARTIESFAARDGVFHLNKGRLFPFSFSRGHNGLLNHHDWGRGHHHLL
tara:strand:+ start:127 stop:645 length:519 start_codon:yes stop_codon:yes gene_type:complete